MHVKVAREQIGISIHLWDERKHFLSTELYYVVENAIFIFAEFHFRLYQTRRTLNHFFRHVGIDDDIGSHVTQTI